MSVKWKAVPDTYMNDMPLVIRMCVGGGDDLANLGDPFDLPDGKALAFVGPVNGLLKSLKHSMSIVRNPKNLNLGVFYYRLGILHAGLRSAVWAAGLPITTAAGLAKGGGYDITHIKLPYRENVQHFTNINYEDQPSPEEEEDELVWPNPLRGTAKVAKVAAQDAGGLFPFAFKRRASVVVFPGNFHFNAKEYGGKAVKQIGNSITLDAIRTICKGQLGG